MISVKIFKRENQRYSLYNKRETRTTYEPHQQTTTDEHHIPDLGQELTNAAGFNVSTCFNLHPYLKQ